MKTTGYQKSKVQAEMESCFEVMSAAGTTTVASLSADLYLRLQSAIYPYLQECLSSSKCKTILYNLALRNGTLEQEELASEAFVRLFNPIQKGANKGKLKIDFIMEKDVSAWAPNIRMFLVNNVLKDKFKVNVHNSIDCSINHSLSSKKNTSSEDTDSMNLFYEQERCEVLLEEIYLSACALETPLQVIAFAGHLNHYETEDLVGKIKASSESVYTWALGSLHIQVMPKHEKELMKLQGMDTTQLEKSLKSAKKESLSIVHQGLSHR